MFTHDFSPLVLGMFLAAASLHNLSLGLRSALVSTLVVFWTFPLYFLFVSWHCLYIMAIVLITFVCASVWAAGRTAPLTIGEAQTVVAG